jgi:hypothetical protein
MQSVEGEDPAVLIMDGPPDDVRLPPDLGGHIERVRSSFMGPCPHCRAHVRHLVLETCSVAECDRFYWYRSREDNDQ